MTKTPTNMTCKELKCSFKEMRQKAFINKSNTLCFEWISLSLPLSVSFFTFFLQGWLKTITLPLCPFPGKRHQQSAAVNTEAKHFHPHSSIFLSPSKLFLSRPSLWPMAFFHDHLNLRLFNVISLVPSSSFSYPSPQWSFNVLLPVSVSVWVSSHYVTGLLAESTVMIQVAMLKGLY